MDAIFALPHKTTAQVLMNVFDSGVPIVDLSGDTDCSLRKIAKYYDPNHPCHEESANFVYGLPELNREAIANGKEWHHQVVLRRPSHWDCYPWRSRAH